MTPPPSAKPSETPIAAPFERSSEPTPTLTRREDERSREVGPDARRERRSASGSLNELWRQSVGRDDAERRSPAAQQMIVAMAVPSDAR